MQTTRAPVRFVFQWRRDARNISHFRACFVGRPRASREKGTVETRIVIATDVCLSVPDTRASQTREIERQSSPSYLVEKLFEPGKRGRVKSAKISSGRRRNRFAGVLASSRITYCLSRDGHMYRYLFGYRAWACFHRRPVITEEINPVSPRGFAFASHARPPPNAA